MPLKQNWRAQGPAPQPIFEESSTQKADLGQIQVLGERVFRYAKAGATALAVGKLMQSVVVVANHANLTCAAAAVGDTTVTVTLGATLASVNQYAEGYLYINDVDGEGHSYKIKKHPSAAASATLVVTLYDSIRVALTASSQATLERNPYEALIIHPSPPTANVIGIPPIAITASNFFWIQTAGPTNCLIDGTPGAGLELAASDAVDGAVEIYAVATGPKVGRMMGTAGVDTEYQHIWLNLEAGI